jgi:activating signal cointegrator complex subunit 3
VVLRSLPNLFLHTTSGNCLFNHAELLDLEPLPVTALGNPQYEALYRFTHFNPIQTQVLA